MGVDRMVFRSCCSSETQNVKERAGGLVGQEQQTNIFSNRNLVRFSSSRLHAPCAPGTQPRPIWHPRCDTRSHRQARGVHRSLDELGWRAPDSHALLHLPQITLLPCCSRCASSASALLLLLLLLHRAFLCSCFLVAPRHIVCTGSGLRADQCVCCMVGVCREIRVENVHAATHKTAISVSAVLTQHAATVHQALITHHLQAMLHERILKSGLRSRSILRQTRGEGAGCFPRKGLHARAPERGGTTWFLERWTATLSVTCCDANAKAPKPQHYGTL